MATFARHRRRRGRPPAQPTTTATLFDALFRRLKLGDEAQGFFAMRAFELACGDRIRKRARAERLRGRTLFIRVSSAAWSQELHALKRELLDKLHATPGGEIVHDLRFSVGPIEEMPTFGEPVARPDTTAAPTPGPDVLPEAIEQALDEIDDPALRKELRELALRDQRRGPARP